MRIVTVHWSTVRKVKKRMSSYRTMEPWHRLKTRRLTDPVCQRDDTPLLLLLGNSSRSRLEFLPNAPEVVYLQRKHVCSQISYSPGKRHKAQRV